MNVLAIGAHPDDIEIGCGATLIKYRQKEHKVYTLIMTDGAMGGDNELRRNEQLRSNEIIGVEKMFWGGYKDTQLPLNKDIIAIIEDVIDKVDPVFIFVNYFDDTHQDHRHLAKATISATRYIKNVLFFEVPTTHNFSPSIFVSIEDVFEEKNRILLAHESQVMKTNIGDLSIVDVARAQAGFRGMQGRVKYAEGFVPQRLFINV
ncbi:MAG: PIG-L family deacetylase [Deltaproteobacteria bacterium]|nr:PIG-L family deacetylase [Deltaproteobacteria bacterium]